jgi:hypothetical protein
VILQKPPRQYSIRTQVYLVFALTVAVYNYMNMNGYDPEAEALIVNKPSEEDNDNQEAAGTQHDGGMNSQRNNISQLMWKDYQAYIPMKLRILLVAIIAGMPLRPIPDACVSEQLVAHLPRSFGVLVENASLSHVAH